MVRCNLVRLVFAGPVPIWPHTTLKLAGLVFTAVIGAKRGHHFSCPQQQQCLGLLIPSRTHLQSGSVLPLLPGDPLATEQFCLVLTAGFSLVMVLGEDYSGCSSVSVFFEPEVVEQAWQSLRNRVGEQLLSYLAVGRLVKQYYPVAPVIGL